MNNSERHIPRRSTIKVAGDIRVAGDLQVTIQQSSTPVGPWIDFSDFKEGSFRLIHTVGPLDLDVDVAEAARLGYSPIDPPAVAVETWLARVAFFVPRSIREPLLGDLREDLDERRRAGCRPSTLWWIVLSQVACAIGQVILSIWRR